jgi:hypothetical protein
MTIIIIGYIIASLLTMRPLTGHLAWVCYEYSKSEYEYTYRGVTEPKPSNWIAGGIFAVALCAFWPLIITWQIAGRVLPKIGLEKQHELQKEIEARKERDKELGLEPWKYGRIT